MRLVVAPDVLASGVLTLTVVLSVLPYVSHLGFYSDDWSFLALMRNAPDQSISGLMQAQIDSNVNLRMRPLQAGYQASVFSAFGAHPFGYHVVNAAILALATLLFYAVLRELTLPRSIAVAVSTLFAVMPNYSTDRFWFAAFGYTLTLALYFLSLYADLRAVRAQTTARLVAWTTLALGALVASGAGYEVVLPLFAVNMVIVWKRASRIRTGGLVARLGGMGAAAYVASHYLLLAAVIGFKAATAKGVGIAGGRLFYLVRLTVGPAMTNFGTYGIALPHTAWWALRSTGLVGLLTSTAIGFVVFAYTMASMRAERWQMPGAFPWLRLAGAGIAFYALGYVVFLSTARFGISSSGIDNRINIGAAPGVTLLFVGLLGAVTARVRSAFRRRLAFASAVAALCFMGAVVVSALATFWAVAWQREDRILDEFRSRVASLPSSSSVILAGTCPYFGPAIVFESPWDLRGALRLFYRDQTLRADVVTPRLTVGPSGVRTTMYGLDVNFYPFTSRLFLFDARTGAMVRLPNARATIRYLEFHPSRCLAGTPGRGVIIFPFDRLYARLEEKGFRPWR
jgi:hypothetical protein